MKYIFVRSTVFFQNEDAAFLGEAFADVIQPDEKLHGDEARQIEK